MKKLVLAAGALAGALAVAAPAIAADLVLPPVVPTAPPAPPPPVFTWEGHYAGALLGYGWGTFGAPVTASSAGLVAGGFVGFNRQRDSLVFGLEADGLWSGRSDGAGNEVNWTASLRGRLGFAFGAVQVYATGGLAVAGVTTATPSASTEFGWTAGGGVEFGGESIFARVEYLYANYGPVAGAGATTLTTQEVRAGVGFRF